MEDSRDKRSRGKVSHSALPKAALDSTPAATHSPTGHIATGDHTPGVSAKPHTESRAAAVVADRNHSHPAGYTRVTGRKLKADRRMVAGHIRLTGDS